MIDQARAPPSNASRLVREPCRVSLPQWWLPPACRAPPRRQQVEIEQQWWAEVVEQDVGRTSGRGGGVPWSWRVTPGRRARTWRRAKHPPRSSSTRPQHIQRPPARDPVVAFVPVKPQGDAVQLQGRTAEWRKREEEANRGSIAPAAGCAGRVPCRSPAGICGRATSRGRAATLPSRERACTGPWNGSA